jgi:DNA-binding transcriptional MerR regulator
MSEDFIFETLNEKRYAPPSQAFQSSLYDAELEGELKTIPDKMAFKIGEVAELLKLKPYVIRYWETEFDELKPQKSQKNQRMFLRKDVEMVFMIRKLLHRDRFSIEGARVALKRLRKDSKQIRAVGGALSQIEAVKAELEDLILQLAATRQLFDRA